MRYRLRNRLRQLASDSERGLRQARAEIQKRQLGRHKSAAAVVHSLTIQLNRVIDQCVVGASAAALANSGRIAQSHFGDRYVYRLGVLDSPDQVCCTVRGVKPAQGNKRG